MHQTLPCIQLCETECYFFCFLVSSVPLTEMNWNSGCVHVCAACIYSFALHTDKVELCNVQCPMTMMVNSISFGFRS